MWRTTMKSLAAHKRRLLATCSAVLLGVAFLAGMLVLGDTLTDGFGRMFTEANSGTDVVVRSSVEVGEGDFTERGTIDRALVDEIAAVDGVDAVFVGPADLAASLGVLGQQNHPDVRAAVLRVFEAVKRAGKPVGILAFDPEVARSYADAGADFIAVTADVTLVARGAEALAAQWAPASV